MNWDPYRIMWLFLFFDLPTGTKKERKDAADFRKNLEREGFCMFQYSVYTRFCATREVAEAKIKRVEKLFFGKGRVSVLQVTDRQYGMMVNIWGKEKVSLKLPEQLTLF